MLRVPVDVEPEDAALSAALQHLASTALPEDLGRPFAEWATGLDIAANY
jgi:hypothetical protein